MGAPIHGLLKVAPFSEWKDILKEFKARGFSVDSSAKLYSNIWTSPGKLPYPEGHAISAQLFKEGAYAYKCSYPVSNTSTILRLIEFLMVLTSTKDISKSEFSVWRITVVEVYDYKKEDVHYGLKNHQKKLAEFDTAKEAYNFIDMWLAF